MQKKVLEIKAMIIHNQEEDVDGDVIMNKIRDLLKEEDCRISLNLVKYVDWE